MRIAEYSASRLTFKRDVIEPLEMDDLIVIDTPEGVFEMTKADFYKTFPNVIESASYRSIGNYNYKTTPEKAFRFKKNAPLKSPDISNPNNYGNSAIDFVGDEIRTKIHEIGKLWKNSEHNKKIAENVCNSWQNLIDEWVLDETIPLFVRKETSKKGQSIKHPSGREIIFADNSVAVWAFYNALQNKTYTVSDIKKLIHDDEIPVMFIATKELKENAKYKKALGSIFEGWKLCHIESVGFNSNKKITDLSMDEIKSHFKKYVNPNNMFALPKEIGDLGELKDFIEEQK